MSKGKEVARVLIVSHHPVVRAGFVRLLEGQAGLAAVGEAGDLASAVALVESQGPDLVILDIDRGVEDVANTIARMLAVNARLRVLFISGDQDPATEAQAIAIGAHRVVSRNAETGALLLMIRAVLEGHSDPGTAPGAVHESTGSPSQQAAAADRAKLASLTRQERNVLMLVVAGLPNRPIAKRLSISERTVRNHMTSILQKLNLTNRVELILFAYQHKLASRLDASRVDGWQPSP